MSYFTHSNPTVEEIGQELTSVFHPEFADGKNAEFLATCVKMSELLTKTQRVEQELKLLEERLKNAAGREFDKILAHYRARTNGVGATSLEDQFRHLFSRQLTNMEIHLGFNTFNSKAGERAQTYIAFLTPEMFRSQIRLGLHWKDAGVPGTHGEYTHRLQWFLLASALKQELANPVQQFMRIGGVIDPNGENKPNGLWDALFDRTYLTSGNKFKVEQNLTDCRCPESLTEFIVADSSAEKWPLIHWYIKSRLKKRQGSALNEYFSAKNYVESKKAKFGLDIDAKSVVGKDSRVFGRGQAPGVLKPGTVFERTKPQLP